MIKPELEPLKKGQHYKTLKITGLAGTIMPTHYTTQEAVVVIQEGEALLKMPDADHLLTQGDSFIIPAEVEHSLEVKKDFKAIAIMTLTSEIKFKG